MIDAPESLCFIDPDCRDHGARDQAVAYSRIEVAGAFAKAVEVERGAFGGRDDVSCRPSPGRFGNRDALRCSQTLGYLPHSLASIGISGRLEIPIGHRNPEIADAVLHCRKNGLDRPVGLVGIVDIKALHGIEGDGEVADTSGHWTKMIEASHEGEASSPTEPSVSRLQTERSTKRRGYADRAVGIGTKSQRDQPGGNGGPRPARGTAGHVFERVRVARWAGVDVFSSEIVGVFAHVETADEYGAGRLEPTHKATVAVCRQIVVVDLRTSARDDAGDVDEVLDRKRDAGQWTDIFARGDAGIEIARSRNRPVHEHVREGVDLRVP